MTKRIIEVAIVLLGLLLLLLIPKPKEVEARAITIEEVPIEVILNPPVVVIEEKVTPYEFIPLSDDLQVHMITLCNEMDLDFFLCASLMDSESSFNEDAVSKDGKDIGLFQIRASVWEEHFSEMGLDIYDPRDNIECGLLIIRKLCDKYPVETALQCYKCGESRGLQLMNEGIVLSSIKGIIEQSKEWQRKEP